MENIELSNKVFEIRQDIIDQWEGYRKLHQDDRTSDGMRDAIKELEIAGVAARDGLSTYVPFTVAVTHLSIHSPMLAFDLACNYWKLCQVCVYHGVETFRDESGQMTFKAFGRIQENLHTEYLCGVCHLPVEEYPETETGTDGTQLTIGF
jgi:hypothetical protein